MEWIKNISALKNKSFAITPTLQSGHKHMWGLFIFSFTFFSPFSTSCSIAFSSLLEVHSLKPLQVGGVGNLCSALGSWGAVPIPLPIRCDPEFSLWKSPCVQRKHRACASPEPDKYLLHEWNKLTLVPRLKYLPTRNILLYFLHFWCF